MPPNLVIVTRSSLPQRLLTQFSPNSSTIRYRLPPHTPQMVAAAAAHPQRHYAAGPPPRRKPTPSEIFNLSSIPLSSFEAVIARNQLSFTLPASEYYSCVQAFAQHLQHAKDPWSLSTNHPALNTFSPETIHATACILRQVHQPPSSDALATALWLFASDSSSSSSSHSSSSPSPASRAATLSLARYLILSRAYATLPPLKRIEARFKHLVASARDPDALTAEGELLLQQNNPEGAARALARALDVARGAGFEWMPHCRLALAKAYLRQRARREDGERLLRELAAEGSGEAQAELAEMLGAGTDQAMGEKGTGTDQAMGEKGTGTGTWDEATGFAHEAAVGGVRGGFERLAGMSVERARGLEEGSEQREDLLRWATEWSRLADPTAEY